jgi:FkbM family methyltransferase
LPRPMPLGLLKRLRGAVNRVAGKPTVDIDLPFERLGTEYGGYGILLDRLGSESVVYSFGLGEDISFDLSLIERVRCKVFGFDPTPRSIAWIKAQSVPPELELRQLGIADRDGEASFAPPENPEHISHSLVEVASNDTSQVRFQVRRLSTLMRELGHERIDVLKMDVEGAEYAVLEDLAASRIFPKQLLVEFHHGRYGISASRTRACLERLAAAGYLIFDVQPSGHELSLLHAS